MNNISISAPLVYHILLFEVAVPLDADAKLLILSCPTYIVYVYLEQCVIFIRELILCEGRL